MGRYLTMLLAIFIASNSILIAQNDEWQTETTKNGTEVKYQLGSRTNADGDEQLVVQYVATKKVTVDINKAATFLNNAKNYVLFLQHVDDTRNVGRRSNGSWVLYQYIDPPWPMPSADCVQEVSVTNRSSDQLTVFLTAAPGAYKKGDVERMDLSDMEFRFKKLSGNTVEITITSKFAPIGSPPKFLMNTWFPGGPEGIIDRLVEQINKL